MANNKIRIWLTSVTIASINFIPLISNAQWVGQTAPTDISTYAYRTGNLSIGTGTVVPGAKLLVFGGNAFLWGITIGYGTGTAVLTTDDASKPMSFQIAGVEKMKISPNGNVGIGASIPNVNGILHIVGAYSGGTASDLTDVSNAQLRLEASSGYIRVPHISAHATVSAVYNYQNNKSVYWGEPGDLGSYNFRGRNVLVTEGIVSIGTSITNTATKLDVMGQVIVNGLSLSRNNTNRGSIWFANNGDLNHRLYNNGSNQDGEGIFDGIKWNIGSGLSLRMGGGPYTEVLRVTQGSVGIGTPSPNAPLQFANADANRKIVLSEVVANDNQVIGFGVSSNTLRYQVANNTTGAHVFYAGTSSTASNELMRITGAGSIGIGTPSPNSTAILHVKQSGASTTTWKGRILAGGDNIGLSFGEFNSVARIDAYDPTLASSKDIVMQSSGGMVGIGVIPVAVSGVNIKLQVNGDVKVSGFVRTNDLCVSPGGSCDFVFNDDYNLKTLQDLKAFIKKNKHLPHIQSEKEIVSNGTSFNTMVFGQLRTMEELVLYTIQQQEAIEKQKEAIAIQDKKIDQMEKTIAKLVESKK